MADYTEKVLSGGEILNLVNGDAATDIIISSGATLGVSSGAVLSGAEIHNGASITLGSGAVLSDITIYGDGAKLDAGAWFESGAVISGLSAIGKTGGTINYGMTGIGAAGVTIYDLYIGGAADYYTVNGDVYGGVIDGTGRTYASGAMLRGYIYGNITSVTFTAAKETNGNWSYLHGGTTTDCVIDGLAKLQVTKGTATGTVVSKGTLFVAGSNSKEVVAKVYNTVVSGGALSLAHQTYAENTVLNGGTLSFDKHDASGNGIGALAVSTTIKEGAVAKINIAGAVMDHTTVNSGGYMHVSGGGSALNVTVNAGGNLLVSAGGYAEVVFNPWLGVVSAEEGANVTYLARENNVYLGGADGVVSKADIMENTEIASGLSMVVFESGSALNVTANGDAVLAVSGGYASGAKIADGANLVLESGEVCDLTVSATDKGAVTVGDAVVSNMVVTGTSKGFVLNSGAVISGLSYTGTYTCNGGQVVTTINEGATVYDLNIDGPTDLGIYGVVSGASLTGSALKYYARDEQGNKLLNDKNTSYAGTGSRMAVNIVGSNAAVTKLYIGSPAEANGLWVYVSNGAVVDDVTVDKYGRLQINAGGVVKNAVLSGGSLYVYAYSEDVAVLSGGTINIYNGGSASNVTVDEDSTLRVSAGGTLEGAVIEDGSNIVISDDATVRDLTVSSTDKGGVTIAGGAVVSNLKMSATAKGLTISKGAVVSGINYSGTYTCNGGQVATQIEAGATVYDMNVDGPATVSINGVLSGGSFTGSALKYNARDENGTLLKNSKGSSYAGTGSRMIVNCYNRMENVYFGTPAEANGLWVYVVGAATVASNVTVAKMARLQVSSATVYDTMLSGGTMYLYNNAKASGTILNNGAAVTVLSGGAYDTIMNSGTLKVSGGATATIAYNPWSGGTVNSMTDANITYLERSHNVYFGGAGVGLVSRADAIENTEITSGLSMIVFESGAVTNAKMFASGVMNISGGAVYDTVLTGGGTMDVTGGAVSGINVTTGKSYLKISGGVVSGVEILSGATLNVVSGTVYDMVVHSGGSMMNSSSIANIVNLEVKAGGGCTYNVKGRAYVSGTLTFDFAGAEATDKVHFGSRTLISTTDFVLKVDNDTAAHTYTLWSQKAKTTDTFKVQIDNVGTYTIGNNEYIDNLLTGVRYQVSAVDGGKQSFIVGEATDYSYTVMTGGTLVDNGADVNGTDKAAELADSNFSGEIYAGTGLGNVNGWLMLDTDFADTTDKQNGKVYGGGASGNITGTVNIKAEGATIGNLLGGGAAGTTDNNINIEIGNATVAAGEGDSTETVETTVKAVYGGGHGDVNGNINIGINGGNITSQLVGGTVRTTGTADVAGEISLTVKDIEFTGANIVGGSYINFTNNASAASVGSVSVNFAGGTAGDQTTGTGANLYGAGYAYSTSETGLVNGTTDYTVTNGVTIDITGGTVGSRKNGSGIFGGVFAAKVEAEVQNGVTITLSGADTVAGNIFGGGWAQQGGVSDVKGGVDITIEGGSANVIYGGGAHSGTSNGTTSVDSVNITVKGGSAKAIYAGGQTTGDVVTGDAAITVTGSFATATDFYGTGWKGVDTVAGKSTLNFADYTGEVTGAIANFDEIILSGNTVATLNGVIDAAALTVDLTGRTENVIFATLGADSTVAAIDLKADADFAAGKDTWEIVSTTGAKITDFDLFIGDAAEAIDLTVGTALTSGVFNGWGISEVTDAEKGTVTYKFGLLA